MKRIVLTTKIPIALALSATLGVVGCSSTTSEQPDGAASASAEAREADKTASPVTSTTSASASNETTASSSEESSPTDSSDTDGGTATPSRTAKKSSTAVPTASASDAKETDLTGFDTKRTTASTTSVDIIPGNLRVKRGKKYDSVYFPYTGDGTPGYDVRYVENAAQAGSGNPIPLDGDAVLSVTMKGVGYPDPDTTTTFGRVGGGGEVVEGAWNGAPYEGLAMSFLGISDEQPFRVRLDKEGKQLIVDVAHKQAS